MNYWDQEARWLDGPAVVAWLDPYVPHESTHSVRDHWVASLRRRMRQWEGGGSCEVYTLDRYLVYLNMHPGQIPDHCWVESEVAA